MAKKKRLNVAAALWAQRAQPEELTALPKYLYEAKMGITPSDYYHKKASLRKKSEGHLQTSRARPTKEEAYIRQLVEFQQNAIDNGATTWDEIPDDIQKLMEERLLPETIGNLKAAKNPVTDEGLIIVADNLLCLTGHTFAEIQEFKANKFMDGEEAKKVAQDYKAGKITQGDAIKQLGKMIRDTVNPAGEAPQPIPMETGPFEPGAAPPKEVRQTPRDEFIANDATKPKRIDNLEEIMDTETERKPSNTPQYAFTAEIQRLIVAMTIYDPTAWPAARQLVRPEFFEYPPRADLVMLIQKFYDKYQRPPNGDECLQVLVDFLENEKLRNKPKPEGLHLDEYEAVWLAGPDADFSYVRDKARDFAQYEAHRIAIIKSIDPLQAHDYETLHQLQDEARAVGAPVEKGLELQKVSEIKEKPIRWLWPNVIPFGMLTIVSGNPSVGKTFFGIELASRLSTGRPFPGCQSGIVGNSIYMIKELPQCEVLKPRFVAAGADMDRIKTPTRSLVAGKKIFVFDIDRNFPELEQSVAQDPEVKLVVIDPAISFISGKINVNDQVQARHVMDLLSDFATRTGVAMLVMWHFNKDTTQKAIHRTAGSVQLTAAAMLGWSVDFDPDDPTKNRRLVMPSKNNARSMKDSWAYTVEDFTYMTAAGESIETGRAVWEEEPSKDVDVQSIVSPEAIVGSSLTADAKRWLILELQHGPKPASDLYDRGETVGFKQATLFQAKRQLGIKSDRHGYQGTVEWYLPAVGWAKHGEEEGGEN